MTTTEILEVMDCANEVLRRLERRTISTRLREAQTALKAHLARQDELLREAHDALLFGSDGDCLQTARAISKTFSS